MEKRAKRPLFVTWLLLLVLMFTGLAWLRFAATLQDWTFLAELPLSVPPAYLAASGLLWGLVGLGVIYGLWRRQPRAPRALLFAALAYSLYYWVDRLWLAVPGPVQANRPFALFATLGLLVWLFASINRSDVQAYFGDNA